VGRVISPVARNQFNFVLKEPYGVAGLIVPWNYPLLLLVWKLAPALAAGNTVVAKPSEHTPLSTLRLMDALDHLPAGVVNAVSGYGPEAGDALVRHRAVEVVAFTGSQATGRKVAVACAEQLKKCHLELGGNDPFIVDAGVDLDVAARGRGLGLLPQHGPGLHLRRALLRRGQRVRRVRGPLRRLHEDAAHRRPHGAGRGPRSHDQRAAAGQGREKIAQSVAAGARVVVGGRRPPLAKGFFYEPTALVDVSGDSPLLGEETFGPVAPLVRCRDIDDGHRPRRPQRVRPGRLHLHEQPRARHEGDGAGPRRHLLDQRSPDRQRRRDPSGACAAAASGASWAAKAWRTSATANTCTSTT
jgi:acyl-CoA reductase-like NAD-dependent aldehyde dehydrogenase